MEDRNLVQMVEAFEIEELEDRLEFAKAYMEGGWSEADGSYVKAGVETEIW